MRVARLTRPSRIELFDEPTPELKRGEVLVQVSAAAICGSDLNYFRHGGLGSEKVSFPFEPCHEAAGVVVDPNDASPIAAGTPVALDPRVYCGACRLCAEGRPNLCEHQRYLGASGEPGAMRELLVVHPAQLLPVPDSYSPAAAAMLEPLSNALHAASRARLEETGGRCVVFGAGAVGILIAAVLQQRHGMRCALVEPLAHRRELAAALLDLDPLRCIDVEEAHDAVMRWTGGRGADLCVEASGDVAALQSCVACAAAGARVVMVGIPPVDHVQLNPHQARIKELDLLQVRRFSQPYREALEMAGQLPFSLDELVSHQFPLVHSQQAFTLAASYADGVVRALVTP